jgi:hypothetical protein
MGGTGRQLGSGGVVVRLLVSTLLLPPAAVNLGRVAPTWLGW